MMDNARVKFSEIYNAQIFKMGFDVLQLPTYSLEFAPIELFFMKSDRKLKLITLTLELISTKIRTFMFKRLAKHLQI